VSAGTQALGNVSIDGDLRTVRFERVYDARPEELWGALTVPEQLRRWLAPAVLEPRVGGRIVLNFSKDEVVTGTILEFDPPRVFEYSWHEGRDDSVVRFELRPENGATRLVLEHRELPAGTVVQFGAGWHAHLDMLGAGFGGGEVDFWARYRELRPAYVRLAS
jgi:uncharacterized protein YndB with AHSA1/START domain